MDTITIDGKQYRLLPIETPEPVKGIWIPEIGEEYFAVEVRRGGLACKTICWSDSDGDKARLLVGDIFKTPEEAVHHIKVIEARYRVRKTYYELVGDWKWEDGKEPASFPLYDYQTNKWDCIAFRERINQFPFRGYEACKAFTDKVGDDLLLVMEAGI